MAYLRQIHGKSIKSDEISEIDGVGGCVCSQVWVIVPNLPFFYGVFPKVLAQIYDTT